MPLNRTPNNNPTFETERYVFELMSPLTSRKPARILVYRHNGTLENAFGSHLSVHNTWQDACIAWETLLHS